jgi:nucleoside-diphosphate-sugar epimerase
MSKIIGIAGAGWLGLPLALRLKHSGYHVHAIGQNREKTEPIEALGIPYHLVDYSAQEIDPILCETLICCIPPCDNLQDILMHLMALTKPSYFIFSSSISVYHQTNGLVDEQDDVAGNRQLIEAEEWLTRQETPTAILRYGGLIGEDRHPAMFFSGKTGIPNGSAPVNLIHRSDILNFVNSMIPVKLTGTFNLVFPDHPTRKEYYEQQCTARDLSPCEFLSGGEGKIVNGSKITEHLNVPYAYPI